MINVIDKKQCCGCTACFNICSHHAITLKEDAYGYIYPQVDHLLCINCGLCEKVCPLLNPVESFQPINSFVAKATNLHEQITSTSGGIASALSRYFLSELNGIVYGCSGENCYEVKHIRIDNVRQLNLLKGSKYVQSYLGTTYKHVKDDLNLNKKVLFIGTPCQIAGLKKFLKRKYINLYCIDFVCHGVPSQKMLSDSINELNFLGQPCNISFRYKNKESKFCLQIKDENNNILYRKGYGNDFYLSAYLLGLNYRESCYFCKFASINRVSDITIGDFWDRKKQYKHIKNANRGLSQMHINTEQGEKLLFMASSYIYCERIDLRELLEHSEQLREPMSKYSTRNLFLKIYESGKFNKACKIALANFFAAYKRSLVTRILYKIPGMFIILQLIKKKFLK